MGDDGAADDVVLEIHRERAGAAELVQEVRQVGAVQVAGDRRHAARHVRVPEDDDPVVYGAGAGLGEVAVAALLSRHVDDHGARLHGLDHVLQPQLRGGLAGDQRRRDDDVDLLGLLAEEGHLGVDELLAHRLGVAAATLAALLDLDGEELAAEALDLVAHGLARIEGPHDGAESSGGADGGEARDACADDQHLGGRDLAGGGELPGEEAPELVGRLDHRPVAGDVGHGAEGVDLLGARDPGHAVHGQRCDLPRLQARDEVLLLCREDVADERRALADEVQLAGIVLVPGRADLEDHVRAERVLLAADLRADGLIGRVRVGRSNAGAGLDGDVEAQLDEAAGGGR